MPRDGSGVYSLPTGTKVTANSTIESAPYNAFLEDLKSDLNDARPLNAGGTGVETLAELKTLLGITNVSDTSDAAKPLSDAAQNALSGFRNKIINGNFDIWQRGTSQTASGYGSDDRWYNTTSVTSTHSRQAFTLGQTDVPNNPKYYSRTVITSASGAGLVCLKGQAIEYSSTLAGEEVTVSFYARADSAKDITCEVARYYGSGGSPSSSDLGIHVETITLTSAWARYDVTFTLPSMTGKTLGTNDNDCIYLNFWYSAGSDFDARTNALGHQTGTFDLAHVSFVKGDATLEDDPSGSRHIGQELTLCQRYYWRSEVVDFRVCGTSSGDVGLYLAFPSTMRSTPTISHNNISYTLNSSSLTTGSIYSGGYMAVWDSGNSTIHSVLSFSVEADAEL